MQNIDRSQAPKYKIVESISVPLVEELKLDNGIEVYFTNTQNEDISEFIFVVEGGIWNQKNLLEANTCVKLMSEGTKSYSSEQIARKIDFYGAYLSSNAAMHFSSFKLMCLNKYLPDLLALVSEIIQFPVFDKREFELHKNKNKERLTIDLQEVDMIARNELEKMIFGEKYPYGWAANPDDYDKLKIENIKNYYEQNIKPVRPKIFITSNDKNKAVDFLNQYFGKINFSKNRITDKKYDIKSIGKEKIIQKNDALQAAVRIGWQMFSKTHEDYLDFTMLNALLGGYFGSRLMQNIRQKKGYTYSIYSTIKAYKYNGSFEIISEVNKENKNKVIDEIIKEIETLRTQVPSDEEMENMKNYISGSMLRSLDGVFSYSRSLVGFVVYKMGFDYYNQYFGRIKTITPERLTELANKYLNPEKMFKVIVG